MTVLDLWCFYCNALQQCIVHSCETISPNHVYCEFTCCQCENRQEVDYKKKEN